MVMACSAPTENLVVICSASLSGEVVEKGACQSVVAYGMKEGLLAGRTV